jgi:hypothetical protein
MANPLKRMFFTLAVLSFPGGFLVSHEHAVFWWHDIPSMEAILGGLGALFFMVLIKFVVSFASRKEDFYD